MRLTRSGKPHPTGYGAPWTAEQIATLDRMKALGHGASEIAAALGVKPQRVSDRIKADKWRARS